MKCALVTAWTAVVANKHLFDHGMAHAYTNLSPTYSNLARKMKRNKYINDSLIYFTLHSKSN